MPKILHIEDHKQFRDDLNYILTEEGFQIISAPNGKIALDMVENENPDLIICDINMPEISGFELLKVLKSRSNCARIPFVFLSGRTEKKDILNGTNLQADDYLIKPVDLDILIAKIKNLINKNKLFNTPWIDDHSLKNISNGLLDVMELSSLVKKSKEQKSTIEKYSDRIISINLDIIEEIHNLGDNKNHIEPEKDIISIKKLLESITAIIKQDKENKFKPIFIDADSNLPNIIVDYKYFSKSIENIILEMLRITPDKNSISVKIITRFNGEQQIIFSSSSTTQKHAEHIKNMDFIKNVFDLHGIEIEYTSVSEQPSICVTIPHYRIHKENNSI